MTFFSKIQRTIPALKPLLPKAPVQHFHTSSTRVNPLRNMPAAAIPVQQRLALVNLRPYSSDHRNDTEDPFDDKKELALYATVAFSAGFLHTVIVRNSVQAKEIEPVTDSKGTETLNDNQRFLISISDQICEEISEAFDLSIAKVKKYLSRQCFNSESEFADHVYMMFKVRLEVHNFGREEQGLIPISLNLAFKQYCAARFWIIENIKNPKGTSLSLSGRNLYALPPELMNCKHVTELDISNNRLISI
ncbi:MAG: hypothetical protein KBE16_08360, partial [Alphaproteobacteria bacterium]|nr:hypothetical protein [Alphaproteobacteria bacterium]